MDAVDVILNPQEKGKKKNLKFFQVKLHYGHRQQEIATTIGTTTQYSFLNTHSSTIQRK